MPFLTLTGFLHPIIHLGFGIEFNQPAIIAEGLAQAAVHDHWMKPLFLGAEQAIKDSPPKETKSIVQLLDEVHTEKSLAEAAKNGLPNRIREGILAKAADTMINIVKQYRVQPGQLEEETAAMTNAAAYFTGAAQHPPKVVKMDFFYMHCINCSIFFSAFLKQSWLSEANKVRLLEWKVRNDLIMYASRGSPNLLLDEVVNYKPKKPSKDAKDPWDDIIDRVRQYEDDGHGAKLVRALAHGQKICEPYEDRESFRIKKNMWLQLGHMAIDSVEGPEPEWVRGCGFDDAWEKVADRPRDSMEAEDHPKQSKVSLVFTGACHAGAMSPGIRETNADKNRLPKVPPMNRLPYAKTSWTGLYGLPIMLSCL